MSTKLLTYLNDNPNLFKDISELKTLRENCEKIALLGNTSSLLVKKIRNLYFYSKIYIYAEEKNIIDDALTLDKDAVIFPENFLKFDKKPESFDLVISALEIQALSSKELSSFLFSIHDSLKPNGLLYISFLSTEQIEIGEPIEKKAFWNEEIKVKEKLYRADEIISALSIIGFKTRFIENIEVDKLGKVVTLINKKVN